MHSYIMTHHTIYHVIPRATSNLDGSSVLSRQGEALRWQQNLAEEKNHAQLLEYIPGQGNENNAKKTGQVK